MRRIFSLFYISAISAFFLFGLSVPAHAAPVEVNSLDCAKLTINDGSTADWFEYDIPFLVKNSTSNIEGTTYYYDGAEWSQEEPETPLYSVNMDKWLDVLSMKFCTTGSDMRMYAKTDFPMMMVYNHQTEEYQSIYYPISFGENPEYLTLPDTLNGWMVWKMQKKENPEEKPIYFAANILFEDVEIGQQEGNEGAPELGLYRESDQKNFDNASFNPDQDTLITLVEPSDNSCPPDEECEGGNNEDPTAVKNLGFEVEQSIAAIYNNTEIRPSDVVNISMATYHASDFQESSAMRFFSAADTTAKRALQFAKSGPKKLQATEVKKKVAKLKWKFVKPKTVESYVVRILRANGKKLKDVTVEEGKRVTVTGLKSGKAYTALVRAHKKNGKKSAWSSAIEFTTE